MKAPAHFTAQELAELQLTGLPKLASDITRRARREEWAWVQRATGGRPARAYSVAHLPPEAQAELAARMLSGSEAARRTAAMAEAAERVAEERRAAQEAEWLKLRAQLPEDVAATTRARWEALQAFEAFRTVCTNLALDAARARFCALVERGEAGLSADAAAALGAFAPRTLKRWAGAYAKRGMAGLVPKYGRVGRTYESHWDRFPRHAEVVQALLFRKGRFLNVRHACLELRSQFPGDPVPSEATVRRYVERWTDENRQLADKVTDPHAWRGRHLSAVGRADEDVVRLAQVWEVDTTPSDVVLRTPEGDRRFAVIGVVEVYSRMLSLSVVPVENSHAILLTLRRAILDWRRFPEGIRMDNGKPYVSAHTTGVLDDLEISWRDLLCDPGHPEQKPFIERALKTFNYGILEMLPGYVGHNVPQRVAIEMRKRAQERGGLLSRGESLELPLSPDEFRRFVANWLSGYNKERKHSQLGATPLQKSVRGLQQQDPTRPVRVIPEARLAEYETALSALTLPPVPAAGQGPGMRRVKKTAVSAFGIDYAAPELAAEWNGRWVRVLFDPEDVARVYVYSEGGDFICVGRGLGVPGGVSHAAAAKEQRRVQQAFIQEGVAELKKTARRYDTRKAAQRLAEEGEARTAVVVPMTSPAATAHEPAALKQALRSVEAAEQADRPPTLPEANAPEVRAKIVSLDRRDERAEAEAAGLARPRFWSSGSDRYLFISRALTGRRPDLLTEDDFGFVEDFETRLCIPVDERLRLPGRPAERSSNAG